MYWEIAASVLRHFTPWALATLGALGVEVSPDTDSVMLVVMAGVAYLGMQGWSIVRKMVNKPRKT